MTLKPTKKGTITIIALIIVISIIAIFVYQSTCLSCKMAKVNNNCDNDNACTSLKEQLKDPREVFLLSTTIITVPNSKEGFLYFGVKNVFAQSLVLYPDVKCNNLPDNNPLNPNNIAVPKQIEIPYQGTDAYSVYIAAPNKKEKWMCTLTLYNDATHKETFSQKGFTLDVI